MNTTMPPPATPTTQRLVELEAWCKNSWDNGYSDESVAFEGAQSLIRVARTLQDQARLALGLRFAATISSRRGEYAQALEYLFEALSIFTTVDNPRQIAACQNEIGNVYLEFADYADALDYFEASLETCKKLEGLRGPQVNLAQIAIAQKNLGDLQRALDYAEQSCALAHELDNKESVCGLYIFVAEVHALSAERLLASGDAESAKHVLEQSRVSLKEALQLAQQNRDLEAQTNALIVLTTTLCQLGQFDEALQAIQQAIQLSLDLEHPGFKANALLALGQLQSQSGHLEAALEVFERSLGMFEALGNKDKVAFAHKTLAGVNKGLGRYPQALGHFETFYELDVHIRDRSAAHRAQALTVKLDLEQARHESELHRLRANELTHLNQQLERQAHQDALTGLANRRSLEAFCEQHWPDARRSGGPWSMLMLDADHFKLVNDRFSHAVGDAVLKELAEIFQNHCFEHEMASRFGGEEFVLVWRVDGLAAFERCDRLRRTVETHPWHKIAENLSITLSIGWSDNLGFEHFAQVISQADDALYQAKRTGRNRVMPAPG